MEEEEQKKVDIKDKATIKPKKSRTRKILKYIGITLAVLILLPGVLYIRPVQNLVKDVVSEQVSESTGLDISIGRLLLKFPMSISVDDVLILDEKQDTMMACGNLGVSIKILPIFIGDVVIKKVEFTSVYYKMMTEDESMTLIAKVDKFRMNRSRVELMVNRIRLSKALLQGGDIYLMFDNRKAKPQPKEEEEATEPSNWMMQLKELNIKDVNYHMAMMPTIDSLTVKLPEAEIQHIAINLLTSKVSVKSLDIDGLKADYFLPTVEEAEAFARQLPVVEEEIDTVATQPWTILADRFNVKNSSAVYAMKGAVPQEGLDMAYIAANDINIDIRKFYNQGSKIVVPIQKISAKERCGLNIDEISGKFSMDSLGMMAENLKLRTDLSSVDLDAQVDNSFFSGDLKAALDLNLKSSLSLKEAGMIVPSMNDIFVAMNQDSKAEADIEISGNGQQLDVNNIDLNVPNILSLLIDGQVNYAMNPKKLGGDINLDGQLTGGDFIRKYMDLDSTAHVPTVTLSGKASKHNSEMIADLKAMVDSGEVVIDGNWNMNSEKYAGYLTLSDFDVRTVMPKGDIGIIDGNIVVDGTGYDLYKMKTQGNVAINRFDFTGVTYKDINVDALLNEGDCNLDVVSDNSFADLALNVNGNISPEVYNLKLKGNINNVDLKYTNFSEAKLKGRMNLDGKVYVDMSKEYYGALMALTGIDIAYKYDKFRSDSLNVGFMSNLEQTNFRLHNSDMSLKFHSMASLAQWGDSVTALTEAISPMLKQQCVDINVLKQKVLPFDLKFESGSENLVSRYLASTGINYSNLSLNINKAEDLNWKTVLSEFKMGTSQIDTLRFDSNTKLDSLRYALHAGNTEDNMKMLKAADIDGYLAGNKVSVEINQFNAEGLKAFNFGAMLMLEDSVARLSFLPKNPTIATRIWSLNDDNYIAADFKDKKLSANFELKEGEKNYIYLYTALNSKNHNSLNLDLAGISLKEWLTFSPFAPPIEGIVASNLNVYYNNKHIWGKGDVNINELKYGKKRVGDIEMKADLAYAGDGSKIFSKIVMDVDKRTVATVEGFYNDTVPDSYYYMKLNVDRFPLKASNAFLPSVVGKANGYMNADMVFQGTMKDPKLNGYLQFDSTKIDMPVYGVKFDFDSINIPVKDGRVRFNKYDLFSANSNSIQVDGFVDLLPLDKMYADLKINGRNVQVIKGKKTSKSEIFGNGFINLQSMVKGYMNELDMTAGLEVLPGTNLTYVMQTSASALMESTSADDVVTFVELNDTTKKVMTDSIIEKPFSMRLTALLAIKPNALLNVYLSPNGKDRVALDGDGSFNFVMTHQGDMNMTGKYTINDGYVRYSPPMLSEKLFNFEEGSSISFHGDLLNPHMKIKAVQTVKASVASDNQDTRVVPFDIALMIGNTLSELDVKFDLSTEGDMTIANELSGMTQEERSTQAMNMLLYNTYTGPSSKSSSGNFSENMAFSFLESTLNKWAANNISGVDISFGIDQYDKTVDGNKASTMNYSYQVSKSVFNDRFKIVVGGSYSSDESRDNIAQNLFNDVSFEYKLNKKGTAVVKLFHKTEYENILEGEITETGAGFVWKRKISSWKDMFRFVSRIKKRREEKRNEKKEKVEVKAETAISEDK